MIRLFRRSRFGPAALAATLLGLGSAAGLAAAPHALSATPDQFSCRASLLRAQITGLPTIEPFVANGPDDPCRSAASPAALSFPIPLVAGDHISVISAQTVDNEPCTPPTGPCTQQSSATAEARVLDAQVGGTVLRASVLTSKANATDPDGLCGPALPRMEGESHVASVTLAGTTIEVPTTPSDPAHPTFSSGGITLWLREEIRTADSLTERAVELQTPLGSLVVSEAKVDIGRRNNFNTLCGGDCDTPAGNDPFVDPTADSTRGIHPDCAEFSEPKGDGDNTGEDFVHFTRSIADTETSPNNSFTPDNSDEDSRNRFNGKAGFFEEGDTRPSLEGDFYDDEDMHFRLAPLTIDSYLAPKDLAASPWRRFCGTGVILPFEDSLSGDSNSGSATDDEVMPTAPFAPGQMRKFMVETFDAKWLNPDNPGGDQSDYWVIDIYAPGSSFDTTKCDPVKGGEDHGDKNPNKSTLDYHSEGQTIEGNIEIHSERVADAADVPEPTI